MKATAWLTAAAGIALGGGTVRAQTVADSARNPTIVVRADVSAREVRFAKQPELRVTLVGGTLDSVRVLERRNLPERVQPGVTYRDVYIAVEIVGKLHAQCLAERITGAGLRLTADSATAKCDVVSGSAGVRRTP